MGACLARHTRATRRKRHLGACLVEFPLSLTARHTRATHANASRTLADACGCFANALRTLCERFANALRTLALTTIAGQRLDPWTPSFKTRTLLLRIRENGQRRRQLLDSCQHSQHMCKGCLQSACTSFKSIAARRRETAKGHAEDKAGRTVHRCAARSIRSKRHERRPNGKGLGGGGAGMAQKCRGRH